MSYTVIHINAQVFLSVCCAELDTSQPLVESVLHEGAEVPGGAREGFLLAH